VTTRRRTASTKKGRKETPRLPNATKNPGSKAQEGGEVEIAHTKPHKDPSQKSLLFFIGRLSGCGAGKK